MYLRVQPYFSDVIIIVGPTNISSCLCVFCSRSSSQPVMGSTSVAPRDRPRGSTQTAAGSVVAPANVLPLQTTITPRARPSAQQQTPAASVAAAVGRSADAAMTSHQSLTRTAASAVPAHVNSITATTAAQKASAVMQPSDLVMTSQPVPNHVIASQAPSAAVVNPSWQHPAFVATTQALQQPTPGFPLTQQYTQQQVGYMLVKQISAAS